MGLFNKKNPEGRTAENQASRDPQSSDAEIEVATPGHGAPDAGAAPVSPGPAAAAAQPDE